MPGCLAEIAQLEGEQTEQQAHVVHVLKKKTNLKGITEKGD